MAKGVYIGDSTSKARKVKKMYCGVGNLARTVKKGYIGIGGVARPFWGGGGKPTYYGTISPIANAVMDASATTNKNFALIAGGRNTDNDRVYNSITAYDKDLIKNTSATLRVGVYSSQRGKTENYAIFAGGRDANYDETAASNAYDKNLIRYSPPDMRQISWSDGCGSIGSYALFAPSYLSPRPRWVTAYNNELILSSPPDLLYDYSQVSSYNHNYLLFCSGEWMGGGTNITAYDSSLVRHSAPQLNNDGEEGSCRAGDYALITTRYEVEAYDDSLIKTTLPPLDNLGRDSRRLGCGTTTIGDHAIFAGGGDGNGQNLTNTVTVIDADLVRSDITPLSVARLSIASTSINDYAIFAGGKNRSGHPATTVDCYTLV